MPRYFRGLDLDRYDLVIASSHACAVHARPRGDALYVCYCHTPMRYVWLPDVESARVTGAAASRSDSLPDGFDVPISKLRDDRMSISRLTRRA